MTPKQYLALRAIKRGGVLYYNEVKKVAYIAGLEEREVSIKTARALIEKGLVKPQNYIAK